MTDYKNTSGKRELSQMQNSETDLDLMEDHALISGSGNASFFDISQKNLKEFPTYLYEKCLYVKHLYLEGNLLQELSSCFFPSLPCLQWLDVRNNSLRNLPKSIANHCNLEVLLLQGNQIQTLPLELGLVPKLRGIQLLGNPITFPPQKVLKQGTHTITAFLREEYNIQAPPPSTIRPIVEPFYKGVELRDDLLSQKFKLKPALVKYRSKLPALQKKRIASTNLPPLTVKSYHKLDLEPIPAHPKTCVRLSQYKLLDTPPPKQFILSDREDLPNLSKGIQNVGNKTQQSHPQDVVLDTERNRSEAKIQMHMLKEMYVTRIKEMLEKQAAIIQRTKDKEMLRKWRQKRPQRNHKQEPGELPYDTHPSYMIMLSRAELQNPNMARQWQNKEEKKTLKNTGDEMSDIFKSLKEMGSSRKDTSLSAQTVKTILNNEIQMLEQLQKKLQVLHFWNVHQNIAIPSLPVQGQHIHVEGRKNFSQL